jgi:hypothetical protein
MRWLPILTAALAGAPLAGCASFVGPWDIGHRGTGRIAVIYAPEDPDLGMTTQLVVYDRTGARRVTAPEPRAVQWLGRESLLLGLRHAPEAEGYLDRLELRRVDLRTGASSAVGEPGHYFDLAADPKGVLLALGVESADLGDSELQIWDLGSGARLARRAQTLDRPRWSPNGRHLVVGQPRPDSDDAETHEGVSIGGVAISWPRLFRLRRGLEGTLVQLHDGARGGSLAPGGSLPLWWDWRGIWARQRTGLVRCAPDGRGCETVYAPGEERSVVDGCATATEAWLVVRHGEAANEIHRVALTGWWQDARVFHPPPGFAVAAIACTD